MKSSTAPARSIQKPDLTARFVLAGMTGFAAAALLTGAFEPGYHPVAETISSLAAQDATRPVVMIAGFLSAAAALLIAGLTLIRRLTGIAARAGGVLVTLAGVGMVVAGLARTDCSQSSEACLARESAGLASTAHWVHQLVSLALFVALIVAAPLLARGLRRMPQLRHRARPMRWIAGAGLLSLVVFISQSEGDYAGAAQRVFLAVVFGWPVWLTYATSAMISLLDTPEAVPTSAFRAADPLAGTNALLSGTQASFSAR